MGAQGGDGPAGSGAKLPGIEIGQSSPIHNDAIVGEDGDGVVAAGDLSYIIEGGNEGWGSGSEGGKSPSILPFLRIGGIISSDRGSGSEAGRWQNVENRGGCIDHTFREIRGGPPEVNRPIVCECGCMRISESDLAYVSGSGWE